MKRPTISLLAAVLLVGCASLPPLDTENPPKAFHDTRLQYALVTGEDASLAKDFGMRLPPSWAERVAAGVALPLTAATETVFFPVATAINRLAPGQEHEHSGQ